MQISQFNELMAGLSDTFGGVSVGDKFDKRVIRYFRRFEKHDYFVVKRAFEVAEEREQRFPSLNALLEYVRLEVSRNPTRRKTNYCRTCECVGTLAATKDKHEYIFKCPDCDNCSYDYPVWGNDWVGEGYYLKVKVVWDTNDEYTIKGLALLGADSQCWKQAPEDCRGEALKLLKAGWKPKTKIMETDLEMPF